MRRLLPVVLLAILAFPAGSAASVRAATDGTLSVKDGRGTIVVAARGGVIGSFAQGRVTIVDPVDGDGTGPIVTGDDFPPIERSDTTTTWRGTKVRFRLIGGFFKIKIQGRGINLSVVGKGTVTLDGAGTDNDGTFSVNGGDYVPIPDFLLPFPLSAPTP
ncbi:MAG TPA: hypothetical protein VIU81_04880 [Gaiellaceae bacterium]